MSDVEQRRKTHEVTTGLHEPRMAHTPTHACIPIGLPQQQQQKPCLDKHTLYKTNSIDNYKHIWKASFFIVKIIIHVRLKIHKSLIKHVEIMSDPDM